MKIAISFPPLTSDKGTPLLSQNRQFQWFNSPTYIYPVIPAYAATLLSQNGHEVFWDDGIAENLSYENWIQRIINEQPDLVVIETKTPVVKRHWKIINELKDKLSATGGKIVLVGDHVTALPVESLKYSKADYVLSGGDYDFGLLNLVSHLSKGEPLESGWHWREGGEWDENGQDEIINWQGGKFQDCQFKNSGESRQDYHQHDLNTLPIIDRKLTRWELYAYKNGNFKYLPGTYMMSGRDCWWGRCSFCSWTTLFPGSDFRTRSAKLALDEVGRLIEMGVKEIMEDSGSLPVSDWLEEFCQGMVRRGYNQKVVMSCNMRINGIKNEATWQLMKKAGFRFILFGLESANQNTLDRIDKNLKVEEIGTGLKMCKAAGLEPHITAMIGYPWETKSEAQKTVDLAKELFKKGYVDTLQATVLIPYPGTPLYKYCQDNNLLNFTDYDRFDQREQVMKSELTTVDVQEMTQGLYRAFMTPRFVFRKIIESLRSFDNFKYSFRLFIKIFFGHHRDFKEKK
ncbi:MAG: radical SAM protein [Patescibacteria group bacterium]